MAAFTSGKISSLKNLEMYFRVNYYGFNWKIVGKKFSAKLRFGACLLRYKYFGNSQLNAVKKSTTSLSTGDLT